MFYTSNPTHIKKTPHNFYMYTMPEGITDKRLEEMNKKYEVDNDYFVETEVVEKKELGIKTIFHKITPFEQEVYNMALSLNDELERVNSSCLDENFVKNQQQRFILLPFVSEFQDSLVEPIVIATIYEVGIITLQVMMTLEYKEINKINESTPRDFSLEKAKFYKLQSTYKKDDFWEYDILKNIELDSITTYYENFIEKIAGIPITTNYKHRPISWGFGDFNKSNKKDDHEKFVERYKRQYFSHLKNANNQVTFRHSDKDTKTLLENSLAYYNSDLSLWATPSSILISVGIKYLYPLAEEALKEHKKELMENDFYNENLNLIFRRQYPFILLNYFRFHELTFIKKYFLKTLLGNLSKGNYNTVAEYNAVIKDLNYVKLNFDADVLFATDGSPKELYIELLEKSGVNKLEKKIENLINNIKESVSNSQSILVRKNETLILIVSSLLTILIGYNAIKLIVFDLLSNIPYVEQIASTRPLVTTGVIWTLLVVIMLALNIKRWKFLRNE